MDIKIFGESTDFIIARVNADQFVVYSPYSNHVLALNTSGLSSFHRILYYARQNKVGKQHNMQLDENELVLLAVMNEYKILFNNETDWKNADYSVKYDDYRVVIPHRAYLHLTQSCNLACDYCYDKANIGRYKELPTDTWKAIISDLSEKHFDCLVFTGGECMLRSDIDELSSYVKQKKMRLHLLTNGTIPLSESILMNADRIEISLDSIDPEKNAGLRRKSIQYDILKNLLSIPSDYRNKVIIKTVLSVDNESGVDELISFTSAQGYADCIITHVQPYSRNEIVYSSKTTHYKKHTHNPDNIHCCNACFEIIAINSDGFVYPCHSLIKPEFKICNVLDHDWMEHVMHSKEYDYFKENNVNRTYCKQCNCKFICGGMCKAISYNLYNTLGMKSDNYCAYARKEVRQYLRSISFDEVS